MCSYIIWDPAREIFSWNLPLLGRPILWYGFLFALGFLLGYQILLFLLKKEIDEPALIKEVGERFLLYIGLGAIIGSRLVDVLFYQNPSRWIQNPLEIFYIWEGGLASHGGALGILVGICFLKKKLRSRCKLSFSFLHILDYVVIPVALAGALIRIGNFINQEIIGIPTQLPWAIVFLHPAEGGPIVPRHPVQLYESVTYFILFIVLMWIRTKPLFAKEGMVSACFLLVLFGSRFIFEFFKEEQSFFFLGKDFPLTMGQLLTLPFIVLGVWLLIRIQRD